MEFQKIMHLKTLLSSMYNKMHPMPFSRSPPLSSFADCVTFNYLALVLFCLSLILVFLLCIMYHAQVKIIKCLVENIVVDISFNQVGGLCTLCFLEEVCSYFQIYHNLYMQTSCSKVYHLYVNTVRNLY
jgi:hypothetical protein